MRITKIDLSKDELVNTGLEEIKMSKLGHLVLMAGKNGSGKSRILNAIAHQIGKKPTFLSINSSQANIKARENNINISEINIRNFQSLLKNEKSEEKINKYNKDIENYSKNIVQSKNEIEKSRLHLNWNSIETSEIGASYPIIRFVPKQIQLTDCATYSKSELIHYANSINNVGIDNLSKGAFAKVQVVQDKWFNATHPNSQAPEDQKRFAIEDYDKLKQIISIFLNTEIERTINDEATLFGFPLGQTQLSDGQSVLLQYCMAIFSQDVALKDMILILDEPENHLHPSIIIGILERLFRYVSNGQIWIATHSIPILSHFDTSSLWFVENGKISHAGKIPEKVLNSLLGDEDEVSRLQDFISLPAQFASSRYAFESLFEPSSVMTDSNDPQSYQVRADLLKTASSGKLRILDYGVGKGRLISNIIDLDEKSHEKLIDKIDYIGYDKYTEDKEECQTVLARAYGSSDKRYFNNYQSLLANYDKESFDVVIMCNVLHEIDPKDWLKLFQEKGLISSLLKEQGKLLLVEDHQIPIGEKAYQKGFLVLDTAQLKDLFKISEKHVDFTYSDQKGDGRLKAHLIPKRCLINIDEQTRLSAIEAVSIMAREKILEIRDQDKNYKNGKLHGFWTQQFANAQLNLAEFKN